MAIALQALSLMEKAEPVQVRCFTLRLRDQWSMRMQDGCEAYMDSYMASNIPPSKDHETEGMWPLHFKHSHWWKRRSRSKFIALHYACETNKVCECKMVVKPTWIPTWHQTFISLRATRPRACGHCTSSTLIGGKGRVGLTLLHTTLGGPT